MRRYPHLGDVGTSEEGRGAQDEVRGNAVGRAAGGAADAGGARGGPGAAAWGDAAVAGALEVHPATVARVRQQFVAEGLEAALDRRAPRREYPRKLDGEKEARLVAVACGTPPTGYERWSLRLLADELVRLDVVDTVSHETVRQTLQQTS